MRNERDLRKLGVEFARTQLCRAEREEWEIEGVAIYSSCFRAIQLYKIYSRIKEKIVPYKILFLKDFLLIPKIVHTPEN